MEVKVFGVVKYQDERCSFLPFLHLPQSYVLQSAYLQIFFFYQNQYHPK